MKRYKMYRKVLCISAMVFVFMLAVIPQQAFAATQSGWVKRNNSWYYYKNTTIQKGWQKINNYWYYLDGTHGGAMMSGWQKMNGSWYYLGGVDDGIMKSGWQKINGNWYYLGGTNDGIMKSGWQKINNSWYYLGGANDGIMKSGWQKWNGDTYYLGGANDGIMKTGWQKIDGAWYYFGTEEDSTLSLGVNKVGALATEDWIAGNYVDQNGKWVPGYQKDMAVERIDVKMLITSNPEGGYQCKEVTDKTTINELMSWLETRELSHVQVSDLLTGGYAYFFDVYYEDGSMKKYSSGSYDKALQLGRSYYYVTDDEVEEIWNNLQ